MAIKSQEQKNQERELREMEDFVAEKKRLSGISTLEEEVKFKKEKLANIKNA